MIKAKYIANIGQRLAPPSGGWGVLLLMALILLLAWPSYVNAQNNSTNPYINSTQKYRVAMGNTLNTVQWDLLDNTTTPTTTKDLTTLDDDGATWITVGTEVDAVDGKTYAWITIKYIPTAPASFVSGQTWYLVYSEMNGSSCEARRATGVITITANDFSLACGADAERCNSWSDQVFPNNLTITAPEKGQVDFTVNMTKSASHLVKKWSFTGTIVASGTNYENPISTEPLFDLVEQTGSTTWGTYAITGISGNSFTVTVTMNDLNGDNHASDALTFTANIYGPPTSKVDVELTIANGQALSGATSHIVTDENGFAAGDNNQVITLNPIPATSAISMVD